ncbi:MAG TPA: hypothetical protein VFL41_01885 [Gaiellaceae bacterium]|nr:hypothetical protein [Gaiellaceae bacterium]
MSRLDSVHAFRPYSAETQAPSQIGTRQLHLGGTRRHPSGSQLRARRLQAQVDSRIWFFTIELVGELERYEDSYRLCYVRGPEGIIIELAEQIG